MSCPFVGFVATNLQNLQNLQKYKFCNLISGLQATKSILWIPHFVATDFVAFVTFVATDFVRTPLDAAVHKQGGGATASMPLVRASGPSRKISTFLFFVQMKIMTLPMANAAGGPGQCTDFYFAGRGGPGQRTDFYFAERGWPGQCTDFYFASLGQARPRSLRNPEGLGRQTASGRLDSGVLLLFSLARLGRAVY